MLATTWQPARDDRLGPLAVLRQREIGVGLVAQLLPATGDRCGSLRRLPAILMATRSRRRVRDRREGGQEALLELSPLGTVDLDPERVAQEVLGAGVLVKPADQVADRVDEVLAATGWRVQQHVARQLEERAALGIGHAFEHLELDPIEHLAFVRQRQAVGQVEQIVRGDAEVDRRQVGRIEQRVDHALVVGIRLELAAVGRLRPAAHRGLGALGLHVGALDQPDRDPSTPGRHALARPGGDALQRFEGIGNVALQRDASAHAAQPLTIERAHESLGRQLLVAVLLHVEVDELRHDAAIRPREARAVGAAVQAFEAIAEHRDGVFAGQRRDLRVQGRDLDRDHLDLGPLQTLQDLLQPPLGLGFAEDRFAEEVDVHPHAFAAAVFEVAGQQLLFAGQDDVGRLVVHVLLHQRQRDTRQVAAEGLEALHQQTVDGPEKARHALHVEDVRQVLDRPRGIAGAKGLVGHRRQSRLVRGRADHAVEFRLLATFRGCL